MRGQLAKLQLLILDDFGLVPLNSRWTGQMPVKDWHGFINDPVLADAILGRLIHSSHKLALKGESKLKASTQ